MPWGVMDLGCRSTLEAILRETDLLMCLIITIS